jgi:hypothetical protein
MEIVLLIPRARKCAHFRMSSCLLLRICCMILWLFPLPFMGIQLSEQGLLSC